MRARMTRARNSFTQHETRVQTMQTNEAKTVTIQRKQAREFKRAFREIALVESFDYDESEIEALAEQNARYLVAH